MKRFLPLMLLGICACDREPQEKAAEPLPATLNEVLATGERQSKTPLVIQKPNDQAELDRLILAGYTPHGSHLHPPGVTNCPFAKEGNEAVM